MDLVSAAGSLVILFASTGPGAYKMGLSSSLYGTYPSVSTSKSIMKNRNLNMGTIVVLLCIGLAAGILSGMVGVGGGIIIVPALVYFLSMSQHEAQGTSLAVLLLPAGIFA